MSSPPPRETCLQASPDSAMNLRYRKMLHSSLSISSGENRGGTKSRSHKPPHSHLGCMVQVHTLSRIRNRQNPLFILPFTKPFQPFSFHNIKPALSFQGKSPDRGIKSIWAQEISRAHCFYPAFRTEGASKTSINFPRSIPACKRAMFRRISSKAPF